MILALIGAGLALSGALLAMILAKPRRALGDLWIAAWLSAHMLYFVSLGSTQMIGGMPGLVLAMAGQFAVILFAPTQYLAIWTSTTPDLRAARLRALASLGLFAPLLLAIFLSDISVVSGAMVLDARSAIFLIVPPLAILATLYYPVHALLRLRHYRARLKQRLSNLDSSGLAWMQLWLLSAIALLAFQMAVFALSLTAALPVPIHVAILLTAQCIQIGYVGYHGLTRSGVFRLDEAQLDQVATQSARSAAQNDLDTLAAHVAEHTPHLEPDLTAAQLANQLGWAPDRLTAALRLGAGGNFHDFVNRQRVETLKALARDPKHAKVNLLRLAHDAGFGSKSAFYAAFREAEGMTPARWRREFASTTD